LVLPCQHQKSSRNGKTLLHKKSLVFLLFCLQNVPHSHSSNPQKYTKYFHNGKLADLDCHHFEKAEKKASREKMKVWSLVCFSPVFATHFEGLKKRNIIITIIVLSCPCSMFSRWNLDNFSIFLSAI